MTVAELIRPGDKVDISFIQQIARMNEETPKIYKSQVLDMKENGNIDVSMPSEGTKLILLPLGVRMEFVFYSRGGLYRAMGQIIERYKSDNIYSLEIELKTQLEKFQRREFFRYPCLLDFNFYRISDMELNFESGDALLIHLRETGEAVERECEGSIVDLSGGGIRFRTNEELESTEKVLFSIHLQNENLNKQYYILGEVISCVRVERAQRATSDKKYEVRAKFRIKDSNIREEIVRFIFEEERKERQRGRW